MDALHFGITSGRLWGDVETRGTTIPYSIRLKHARPERTWEHIVRRGIFWCVAYEVAFHSELRESCTFERGVCYRVSGVAMRDESGTPQCVSSRMACVSVLDR